MYNINPQTEIHGLHRPSVLVMVLSNGGNGFAKGWEGDKERKAYDV